MLKVIKILAVFSSMVFMLSGCGAHYVATNKTLGVPSDRKPVVGVIVTSFVVNTESNPMGAILGVKYGEEITQSLKDEGVDAKVIKFSEVQTHEQLAAAITTYNSIADYRKRVSESFNFGKMEQDFNKLGIDILVIISGSASNASVPAWAQAAAFAAFGTAGSATPSSYTVVTAVNREGNPLYNDKTIFARMGRRDFGNSSHRKAMASAIADGIKDNSF
jgi:hypothetical protein